MFHQSITVLSVGIMLTLSGLYGGQTGYYAIVGNNDRDDRGYSPTIPAEPWPDFFCRHDRGPVASICERGL